MPVSPLPPTTIEDILDLLAVIIRDIESIREKSSDRYDRAAVASQLAALGKWWRKLDALRMEQAVDGLENDVKVLKKIQAELKKQKARLTSIAKVIEGAAKAIAIAERVWKMIP